ncbi:ribosome biogenesis protein SLX9-domain-containing protein [Phyllosticta citrichinensis]
MAPVTKRKSLRSKAAAASKPTTSSTTTPAPETTETPFPSFASSKRDKRSIKHSLLLSKITKSAPGSAAGKKRRRPNKKLVTTLDALADALPDGSDAAAVAQDSAGAEGGDGGAAAAHVDVPGAQARIIVKNRSLKSRPGALKRKAAIEARERQRFEQNLAEMAKGVPAQQRQQQQQQQQPQDVGMAEAPPTAEASSTADRWKALRAFIGGTMERR